MRPYSAAPDGTQKWSALVLYFFLVGRAAKQFPDPGPGPGAFTPALVRCRVPAPCKTRKTQNVSVNY